MATGEQQPTSILFVFRRGRRRRLEEKLAGTGPDEMLYGFSHLNGEQFAADFIEDDGQTPGGSGGRGDTGDTGDTGGRGCALVRLLWRPVELLICRLVGMGFTLPFIRENLELIKRADVVISTVDACGLPLALLKARGRFTTPVIYISQGLSDRISAMRPGSWARRRVTRLYGQYLRGVELVVVLGEGARQPLIDLFELDPARVSCLPFGIDTAFWTPSQEQADGDYVLSVGSDPARDYATLLAAIGDVPLKIVTRIDLSAHKLPANVEVLSTLTDVQLRTLYRGAHFVVTPLQDVAQPSGQSATLQAMACAKAVVLTNTCGLWEPSRLRHDENCLLVKPNNITDMQQAIKSLHDDPQQASTLGQAARQMVETSGSSKHFAHRLCMLAEQLVDHNTMAPRDSVA